MSVSITVRTSWRSISQRSNPAPVSTFCAGNGRERPVGWRKYRDEHEVPELDVAVAPAVRRARPPRPTRGRSRSGSPSSDRTGRSRPSPRSCPLSRRWIRSIGHPDRLVPDRLGGVVGVVDRGPDAIAVEARPPVASSQAHLMASLLEVLAEAPVAEHLEEGEVAAGAPISSMSLCLPARRTHFWIDDARAGRRAPAPRRGSTGRTASSPSW